MFKNVNWYDYLVVHFICVSNVRLDLYVMIFWDGNNTVILTSGETSSNGVLFSNDVATVDVVDREKSLRLEHNSLLISIGGGDTTEIQHPRYRTTVHLPNGYGALHPAVPATSWVRSISSTRSQRQKSFCASSPKKLLRQKGHLRALDRRGSGSSTWIGAVSSYLGSKPSLKDREE